MLGLHPVAAAPVSTASVGVGAALQYITATAYASAALVVSRLASMARTVSATLTLERFRVLPSEKAASASVSAAPLNRFLELPFAGTVAQSASRVMLASKSFAINITTTAFSYADTAFSKTITAVVTASAFSYRSLRATFMFASQATAHIVRYWMLPKTATLTVTLSFVGRARTLIVSASSIVLSASADYLRNLRKTIAPTAVTVSAVSERTLSVVKTFAAIVVVTPVVLMTRWMTRVAYQVSSSTNVRTFLKPYSASLTTAATITRPYYDFVKSAGLNVAGLSSRAVLRVRAIAVSVAAMPAVSRLKVFVASVSAAAAVSRTYSLIRSAAVFSASSLSTIKNYVRDITATLVTSVSMHRNFTRFIEIPQNVVGTVLRRINIAFVAAQAIVLDIQYFKGKALTDPSPRRVRVAYESRTAYQPSESRRVSVPSENRTVSV